MYLHKAEASVQSTLRAATNSTITVIEVRVIVSVCVRSSEQESDEKCASCESESI